MDWQLDPGSGYRWPLVEAGRVRWGPGRDVKGAWRRGRMQSMSDPEAEARGFMAANPVGYGVQWATSMEVAIRVANWVRAGLSGEHVLAHGRWIRDHLEPGRRNHYLANVVGLLFVASVEDVDWGRWAADELAAEVRHQFHPEGSYMEGSTAYHRFGLELATWGATLCDLPDDCLERIARARGFARAMGPAVIGDDGGDRLFLDDPPPGEEAVAEGPAGGRGRVPAVSHVREHRFDAPMAGRTLHAYPGFGAYVMRTDRAHLAIRCGPRGQRGKGGHDHDDQLSITLRVDGRDVVRDPGTYAYTGDPEARNLYRSALVHFAPHAEGPDPGRLDRGLFRLPGPDGACARFDEGLFEGWMPLSGGRVVTLRVEADDEGVTVVHGASVPLVDSEPVRWSPAYGSVTSSQANPRFRFRSRSVAPGKVAATRSAQKR